MKAYTDLEQSKKLAEILPIESADMKYTYYGFGQYGITAVFGEPIEFRFSGGKDIPCWSLAALLNYLKSKNKFPEIKELSDGRFKLTTFIWDGKNSIQFSIADNLVDACYEMINELHKLNLLRL